MSVVAAAACAAVFAATALSSGQGSASRLSRIAAESPARAAVGVSPDPRGLPRETTSRLAAGGALLVVAVVGVWGAVLVLAGGAVWWAWRGAAAARSQARLAAPIRRSAPLTYDLLATCLRTGLSLSVAVRIVGGAAHSPLSPALGRLASALDRGDEIAEATAELPGGLERFGRILAGGAVGGNGLAIALAGLAADEREAHAAIARAAAKRAAVWSIGPLALCFLPAFALVGVVPVVAGVFAQVLP